MSEHKAVSAVILVAVFLVATGVRADSTVDVAAFARCRATLAKGVRTLADASLKERARCHRQRMSGLLARSVDCNDPNLLATSSKIAGTRQRLTKSSDKCSLSVPLSATGYSYCPQPCFAPTINTFRELTTCVACLTESAVTLAVEQTYATPPVERTLSECQDAVGSALRRYAVGRFEQQRRCMLGEDLAPAEIDCRTSDASGRIAAFLTKARATVAECTAAELAALDSCADDMTGEQACVAAVADALSNSLYDVIYNPPAPLPTATETPTRTFTPTVTPTRSATTTATRVPTFTRTSTATVTASVTITETPTISVTPTVTLTATWTPTSTTTWTPSSTRTPTLTPSPSVTRTATATRTGTQTPTVTVTSTPTVTDTPLPTATATNPPPVHVDYASFPPNQPDVPCLIFVHGKRTSSGSYTDWNQARSYWSDGSEDMVRTATRNFTIPYYVVGYNGTQPYWEAQAAGEVANEIANATNGGNDNGGNHCALTYAQGGRFWVVAHSMGSSVMDYIVGNASPSDANYNRNGPYDVATQRIDLVISVAGTHRGSQGADYVCGNGNPFCSFVAQFIQDCDGATSWLRSSDDVQVRNYASPPARTVWLTGGYKAIPGASLCLAGEDDGVVQYASIFACNGSATASYDNGDVCNNGSKQELSGFKNLDASYENHDESRNDKSRDDRRAIPGGGWICNGSACSADTQVRGGTSTAELISELY